MDLTKVVFEEYSYLSKHGDTKRVHQVKDGNGGPLGFRDVTENGAKALSTSGNVLVDLFALTVRDFDKTQIHDLLLECWKKDPLMTYQISLYVRDCRGGKGEIRLGVYMMFLIRMLHPETYKLNLSLWLETGYYKDLWRLLDLVVMVGGEKLGENTYVEIEHFVKVLQDDVTKLSEGKPITLAAKWCPKEKSHNDKYLRLIVEYLYPGESRGMEKVRKWVAPLRKQLELLETKMCKGGWTGIDYGKVPAYAMKLKGKTLKSHDEIGFESYMKRVKKGEEKVNVTGIHPHELIRDLETNPQLVELQWKTLLEKVRKETKLDKCLAVSDVSGSMKGVPMEVSVALGLVLAQVQKKESPFWGKVVTFSSNPVLHSIKGDTLKEQVESVKGMEWGQSTDFVKVFKLLLDTAVMYKVPGENMVETIFVFTDMQFDSAQEGKLPMEVVEELYREAGYKVPQLVFWNLSGNGGFPVPCDKKGVSLVSGFSTSLMKLFVEGVEFTPESILKLALEKYKGVQIHESDLSFEELLRQSHEPGVVNDFVPL